MVIGIDELNEHLAALRGLTCWQVGFLDEHPSSLELGDRVADEYVRPGRPQGCHGSWGLRLWFVEVLVGIPPAEPICAAELDEGAVREALKDEIVSIEANIRLDLSIEFKRGATLVATPNQPDEYEYWELFMPGHRIIHALWGPTVTYGSSQEALPEPPPGFTAGSPL